MKAIVVKAFPGRPDREVMTRQIDVGEEIEGDLATVAVDNGWAEEVSDGEGAAGLDGEPSITNLTVAELKALAAERNIDLSGAVKKAEIVAAILAIMEGAK